MSARALIFHMNIPSDKNVPWVPSFFTLWLWTWSLFHFLKTLTLLITLKQCVLELWYFTWIFPVIRPFRGYHYFDPVTLTLEFDPFFENLNLAYNFWTVSARVFIFHLSIPCDKTFPWVPFFLTLWPWPLNLTYCWKL